MNTINKAVGVGIALVLVGGPLAGSGHAAAGAATQQSNDSFAGYRVIKTEGAVKQASASFVVPTITCKKSFGGVAPSVRILTKPIKKGSVTQSGAGVDLVCQNKVATYTAFVIVNGQETNDFVVSPGDKVNATAAVTAARTEVNLRDVTSGAAKSLTGAGATGGTAMIGASGITVSAAVGIEPFTKTAFRNAKVNRKPIGTLRPVALQRTHGKKVQIAVSKLAKRKNFTLTFTNSK